MKIDTRNVVSMTNANQNFSQVAKLVDKNEEIVILKNNKPKYVITKFSDTNAISNDMLIVIAKMILAEHKHAFEVLSKWLNLIKIKFYCYNN